MTEVGGSDGGTVQGGGAEVTVGVVASFEMVSC